jgi:hypothetical protein
MTCKELPGAGLKPTPDNMNKCLQTELSSHEGTRSELNPSKLVIKLGIDLPFTSGRFFRLRLNGKCACKLAVGSKTRDLQQMRH